MSPNSISHRLFAAALAQPPPAPVKRPARPSAKSSAKVNRPKPVSAAVRPANDWVWSGWQHNTI